VPGGHFSGIGVDVGQRTAGALARVRLGNAFANARAGAGHKRDLAIEAHEATPFARGKEGLAATTGGKAATVRPRQGPADINLALSAEQTSVLRSTAGPPTILPTDGMGMIGVDP